jgi:hypothetical protein
MEARRHRLAHVRFEGNAGQVDYEVMVTMDLAPYLHGLPSLHGGRGLAGGGP